MNKTVTLRLDDESYRIFSEVAKSEKRSLSNLIETSALERIREIQFLDDIEMAEILSNKKLLKRIRAGSADAKKRKGSLVG